MKNTENKISLPNPVYDRLAERASWLGLTPDELASQIILRKSMNCHGCGLEDADKPDKPALDVPPCSRCSRNPKIQDKWNERWTLNEKNQPFIEK